MNSGIYAIVNLLNGKRYIGSAVKLRARKNLHLHELRKDKHPNKHLQHSFNKYGEQFFKFIIIEEVEDENLLIECEQSWLDNCKNLYNHRKIADSNLGIKYPPHTEEAKEKISNALKGKIPDNFQEMQSKGHEFNKKPVYQYDEKGNLINEFSSGIEASESLGIPHATIYAACRVGSLNRKLNCYFKRQKD